MGLRDPAEIDSKLLAQSVRNHFKGSDQYNKSEENGSVMLEFPIINNQLT